MRDGGSWSIGDILAACERYWLETRVPQRAVAEMRSELELHLHEAQREGKSPQAVVGDDLASFAEAWASEQRGTVKGLPTWDEVWQKRKSQGLSAIDGALLVVIVAVVGIALAAGPREETMDAETWRWIWVGAVVILGVGEMITAGFFMLPFAVGAVAAALLAFLNVAVALQLVVFIIVSIAALIGLQRYVRHEDEMQPTVGANRYIDRRATVLEAVNRVAGVGRVRMDTEEWRATTDSDGTIDVGTEVRIVDVRGTRLVVEPADTPANH